MGQSFHIETIFTLGRYQKDYQPDVCQRNYESLFQIYSDFMTSWVALNLSQGTDKTFETQN